MPAICFDDSLFYFPSVDLADEEGLVMMGGRVTPGRVLEAYTKGIFPWYNDDSLPLWWSPDPRFVLFPSDVHVSRSMQKIFRKNRFEFRENTAFDDVLEACATSPRKGTDGTWLTPEMKECYRLLHRQGFAHSAEAWQDGKLVGGVYGIRLGRIFFGESMFSHATNASKFAFITYIHQLQTEGVTLIDCQVYSEHVESLGARLMQRADFLQLLEKLL